MKLTNLPAFYKQYPELDEIAIRIEESKLSAEKINAERFPRKNGTDPAATTTETPKGKHGTRKEVPEHFLISDFYKNGKPEKTPYIPKMGRQEFEEKLATVLNTRDPDGIRIKLFSSSKESTTPLYQKDFWFTEGAVPVVSEEHKEKEVELGNTKEAVNQMIETFRTEIAEAKKGDGGNSENLKFKLLEKNFETQLTAIRHSTEKKELKDDYEKQLTELREEMRGDQSYIKELEAELDDQDGELGSIKKEFEKKSLEENDLVQIFGGVLKKGVISVLIENPKLTEALSGLTPDAQKKIFEKYTAKRKEGGSGGTDAEFTPAAESADEFAGLDPKHKEGCEIIRDVCKSLPFEEFKKVYYFFQIIAGADQKVDIAKLNKAYTMLVAIAESEKEK